MKTVSYLTKVSEALKRVFMIFTRFVDQLDKTIRVEKLAKLQTEKLQGT
jgi:hypothetical protein